MKLRSHASLGFLVLLGVLACGRTEDNDNGGAGGPAGGSAGSGVAASGGKLGVGGSPLGGASGKGGSIAAGGASGEGNARTWAGASFRTRVQAALGPTPLPLGEGSWDTTLALTVTKSAPQASVSCAGARFTLHFSPSGSNLKALSGRDGTVLAGELIRGTQSSPSYSVSQPLRVPTRGGCDLLSIDITELTLQAWDETGDGVAR